MRKMEGEDWVWGSAAKGGCSVCTRRKPVSQMPSKSPSQRQRLPGQEVGPGNSQQLLINPIEGDVTQWLGLQVAETKLKLA